MNIVVLQGVLTRDAEARTLPSGEVLLALELSTRDEARKAESVPVVWSNGTDGAALVAGAEVLVTGRVRRRFFRTAAGTQSRTEVVAAEVVPVKATRRVRRAVDRALAPLVAPLV